MTDNNKADIIARGLREDHANLDALAASMADCVRTGDSVQMAEEFREFERRLLEHMNWEEMYLLPGYAKRMPRSARSIRDEHESLREQLGTIGLDIELHAVSAAQFDTLIESLTNHAKRENELYEWSDVGFPEKHQEKLRARLKRFAL